MADEKQLDLSGIEHPDDNKELDLSGISHPDDEKSLASIKNTPEEEEISNPEAIVQGLMSGAGTSLIHAPQAAFTTGLNALAGNSELSLPELYEQYKQTLAQNNQREEMARKQKPWAYYGGMLAGGSISPLGSLVEGPELAKTASVGAKLENAAATGAKIGGLYGAGEAGANVDLEGNVGQELAKAGGTIAQGIGGGAAIGGIASGIGQAAESGINSLAQGNTPLLSNAAKRLLAGFGGGEKDAALNLYNTKQITDNISDAYKGLGQGISDGLEDLSSNINDVLSDATKKDQKVDFSPTLDKIKDLREEYDKMPEGTDKKELSEVLDQAEYNLNKFKEVLSKKTYKNVGMTEEIPGEEGTEEVPATKSTKERMQDEADAYNEQAERNEKVSGTPQPRMIVHPEVDGKIATVIKKPGESGMQTVGQWESPQEGTPAIQATEGTAGILPQNNWQEVEQPVLNPELTPQQGQQARTDFGKQFEKTYQTGQARQLVGNIYASASDDLARGIPAYPEQSKNYKLFKSAMEDLGIGDKLLKQTAEEMAGGVNGSGTMLNTDVTDALKRSFEKAEVDKNHREALIDSLSKLKKAGFPNIDALTQKVQEALRIQDLSGGPQPKALLTPIGGPIYKGIKAAQILPNAIGLAANKATQAGILPTVAGTTRVLTPALAKPTANTILNAGQSILGIPDAGAAEMPVPPKKEDFLHKAKDFLGNKRNDYTVQNSTPVQNFSRDLTSASSDQLQPVANVLKTDKSLSFLGTALEKAVADNNTIQKNAIIFAISQNPAARKLLSQGK